MDPIPSRVALVNIFHHFIIEFSYLSTSLLTWYLVVGVIVPTLGETSSSYPIMNNHRYDHHSSSFASSPSSSSTSNNPQHQQHHYIGQSSTDQPYFAERMQNLTIPVGREATFTCLIHNLKNHQVAWFHKDKHTLLALQDNVITRNSRIRVSSQAAKSFSLHINDVQQTDAGHYSCQVNSSPMKSQSGHLEVVVPPRFVEHLTSSDLDSPEDSSVSLRCVANGFPMPEIKWRREDGRAINIQSQTDGSRATIVPGKYLNITKLQRLDSGAYICIANNGVPPASSKRIFLGVTFSPMIWTPKQTVGAAIGQTIVLECVLESYPRSITHWSRLNGPSIIESSTKYESIVSETGSSVYKSEMMLKINNVSPSDFGSYVCSAKNLLGETTGRIKVYEIPKSSIPSPTNVATTSHKGSSDDHEKRKDSRKVIGSKTDATSSSSSDHGHKRKGMTTGKNKKNPSDLHSKHKTLERNHEDGEEEREEEDSESEDDEEKEETLRSSLRSRTRGLSTPSSSSSSSSLSSSSYFFLSSFFTIIFCLLHQGHSYSTIATKNPSNISSTFPFSYIIFYFLSSFLNAISISPTILYIFSGIDME